MGLGSNLRPVDRVPTLGRVPRRVVKTIPKRGLSRGRESFQNLAKSTYALSLIPGCGCSTFLLVRKGRPRRRQVEAKTGSLGMVEVWPRWKPAPSGDGGSRGEWILRNPARWPEMVSTADGVGALRGSGSRSPGLRVGRRKQGNPSGIPCGRQGSWRQDLAGEEVRASEPAAELNPRGDRAPARNSPRAGTGKMPGQGTTPSGGETGRV